MENYALDPVNRERRDAEIARYEGEAAAIERAGLAFILLTSVTAAFGLFAGHRATTLVLFGVVGAYVWLSRSAKKRHWHRLELIEQFHADELQRLVSSGTEQPFSEAFGPQESRAARSVLQSALGDNYRVTPVTVPFNSVKLPEELRHSVSNDSGQVLARVTVLKRSKKYYAVLYSGCDVALNKVKSDDLAAVVREVVNHPSLRVGS